MTNKELQEKIYDYGHVMYRLGRMETDEKESTKEYNKFCKMKEEITKDFDEHFDNSINQKLKNTLGV